MKLSHGIFERFGEDITVGGATYKGFISPVNSKKRDNVKKPTAAGVINNAEYLLLCECALSPAGGETVIHKGVSYVSLRAEPIYYCGEVSHYEAVLRRKGGNANV